MGCTTRSVCRPHGMHIPADGEGLSMEEEIARWNEFGRATASRSSAPLPE